MSLQVMFTTARGPLSLLPFFPLVILPVLGVGGSGVGGLIENVSGSWRYALVFVLAATPWIEVVLVIPAAIALDLNPVVVAIVAFLGNAVAVYVIVLFYRRIRGWWRARRSKAESEDESKRSRRARRLWDRYGMAGLALASPLLTGIHLATFLGLALGASDRSAAGWMTVSLVLWTVVLTVASVWGLSFLGVV